MHRQRLRVVLGLQQARDELLLPGLDPGRRLLQPEIVLEPVGDQVGVAMPPARLIGACHHLEEDLALGGVGDAVHREEVRHVAHLEADPAQLQPADLRLGAADGEAGLGAGDLGGLPQPAQPGAQHDPACGGTATLPGTRRVAGFICGHSRFLAGQAGITQFLDCGSGLPTAENTHQVVQRVQPDAQVVYIDNDPTVIAHGRALLVENDLTHFSDADIFHPQEVLNDEVVCRHLDFSEPIALYQLGTLHHYDDEPSPQVIMQEYIDALPSGSYVAISHFFDPGTSELSESARKMEQMFLHSMMGSGWFRTRAEIEGMLAGLELVEPGLARCVDWWPDGPRIKPLDPVQHCIVGAVGRKP